MAARGKGSIINISSMAGRFGLPGGAAYGATKAALVSLTQAWTAEFSPRGVRVNAVAPGPVNLPRFRGHPKSHESAVGVVHGQAQAAGVHEGV